MCNNIFAWAAASTIPCFSKEDYFLKGTTLLWIQWWFWSHCKWVIDHKGTELYTYPVCSFAGLNSSALLVCLSSETCAILSANALWFLIFVLLWNEWKYKRELLLFSPFNLSLKVSPRQTFNNLSLNSLQFTSIFLVLKCLEMNEGLYCFILLFFFSH